LTLAGSLVLLRFYNPLSIWVELVEVLHVGIIIKAAFSYKQKRYMVTSLPKEKGNNFQSSCHCFIPFWFSSPLCGIKIRTMQLKPSSAHTLPICLWEEGDRGRTKESRGCATSVACSRSDSSHRPCRWKLLSAKV